MEKNGINFLIKYINKNSIKNILEIGTAIGYSAINMVLIDEDITVTTIEKDETKYLEALKNIKKLDLDKRINLVLGDALDIFIEQQYDLIFIDAAKAQYINFFNKYKNNLKDNGTIITDNINFHGLVNQNKEIENKNLRSLINKIRDYIIFLKEHNEFETKFYKSGDGISVSKRKM